MKDIGHRGRFEEGEGGIVEGRGWKGEKIPGSHSKASP